MIPQVLWLALLFQPSPEPLFAAIRQVESAQNCSAVGDGGRSLGCYQISQAYWADACDYAGYDWPYQWVWLPPKAEQVMRWYWARYGAETDEQRARVHNGGPRGGRRHCTIGYWKLVKKEM